MEMLWSGIDRMVAIKAINTKPMGVSMLDQPPGEVLPDHRILPTMLIPSSHDMIECQEHRLSLPATDTFVAVDLQRPELVSPSLALGITPIPLGSHAGHG